MKKQKPIRPANQEMNDSEIYDRTGCSLQPGNYTDFSSSPALMGTMLQADQKKRKMMNRGGNSLDILNQIEQQP